MLSPRAPQHGGQEQKVKPRGSQQQQQMIVPKGDQRTAGGRRSSSPGMSSSGPSSYTPENTNIRQSGSPTAPAVRPTGSAGVALQQAALVSANFPEATSSRGSTSQPAHTNKSLPFAAGQTALTDWQVSEAPKEQGQSPWPLVAHSGVKYVVVNSEASTASTENSMMADMAATMQMPRTMALDQHSALSASLANPMPSTAPASLGPQQQAAFIDAPENPIDPGNTQQVHFLDNGALPCSTAKVPLMVLGLDENTPNATAQERQSSQRSNQRRSTVEDRGPAQDTRGSRRMSEDKGMGEERRMSEDRRMSEEWCNKDRGSVQDTRGSRRMSEDKGMGEEWCNKDPDASQSSRGSRRSNGEDPPETSQGPKTNRKMTIQDMEKTLRDVFQRCDFSADGLVSRHELIKAARRSQGIADFFGIPRHIRQEDGTRDVFERVFQDIDVSEDKKITWGEFHQYFASRWKTPEQKAQEEAAADQTPDQQAAEQRDAEQHSAEQRAAEQHAAEQSAADERAAYQRAADQRAADQRAADQRAADQRAADQRAADQRAAEQRAAEKRAAEQRAAERATEQRAAEQRATDQRASQQRANEQRNSRSAAASSISSLRKPSGAASASTEARRKGSHQQQLQPQQQQQQVAQRLVEFVDTQLATKEYVNVAKDRRVIDRSIKSPDMAQADIVPVIQTVSATRQQLVPQETSLQTAERVLCSREFDSNYRGSAQDMGSTAPSTGTGAIQQVQLLEKIYEKICNCSARLSEAAPEYPSRPSATASNQALIPGSANLGSIDGTGVPDDAYKGTTLNQDGARESARETTVQELEWLRQTLGSLGAQDLQSQSISAAQPLEESCSSDSKRLSGLRESLARGADSLDASREHMDLLQKIYDKLCVCIHQMSAPPAPQDISPDAPSQKDDAGEEVTWLRKALGAMHYHLHSAQERSEVLERQCHQYEMHIRDLKRDGESISPHKTVPQNAGMEPKLTNVSGCSAVRSQSSESRLTQRGFCTSGAPGTGSAGIPVEPIAQSKPAARVQSSGVRAVQAPIREVAPVPIRQINRKPGSALVDATPIRILTPGPVTQDVQSSRMVQQSSYSPMVGMGWNSTGSAKAQMTASPTWQQASLQAHVASSPTWLEPDAQHQGQSSIPSSIGWQCCTAVEPTVQPVRQVSAPTIRSMTPRRHATPQRHATPSALSPRVAIKAFSYPATASGSGSPHVPMPPHCLAQRYGNTGYPAEPVALGARHMKM